MFTILDRDSQVCDVADTHLQGLGIVDHLNRINRDQAPHRVVATAVLAGSEAEEEKAPRKGLLARLFAA